MNAVDRVVCFFSVILIAGMAVFLWKQPGAQRSTQNEKKPSRSAHERGKDVFQREGCNACHSIDGSPNVGPPLNGLYGTKQVLKDGTIVAKEDYIRESIRYPGRKIVQGYPDNMPSYSHLSTEQINWLVEYITVLSEGSRNGETRRND